MVAMENEPNAPEPDIISEPGKPPSPPPKADVPDAADSQPAAPKPDDNKKWYVVKVQSGREESMLLPLSYHGVYGL